MLAVATGKAELTQHNMTTPDGLVRNWFFEIPPEIAAPSPALIVEMHGFGSQATEIRSYSGFAELKTRGILLLYINIM